MIRESKMLSTRSYSIEESNADHDTRHNLCGTQTLTTLAIFRAARRSSRDWTVFFECTIANHNASVGERARDSGQATALGSANRDETKTAATAVIVVYAKAAATSWFTTTSLNAYKKEATR